MNEQKVQEIINQLIADQQQAKPTFKQYPVAKGQLKALESIGITKYMPRKFGYTDAAIVIEAAQDSGHEVGGFNADGEGDMTRTSASSLYRELNSK